MLIVKKSIFMVLFSLLVIGSYGDVSVKNYLNSFPMISEIADKSLVTKDAPEPNSNSSIQPISSLFVPCTGCTEPFSFGTGPCQDYDGDGVANQCDIDDDNDGILDKTECPGAFTNLVAGGGFTTDPPTQNWYFANNTTNYDTPFVGFPFGYGTTQTNSTNTGGLFDQVDGNNSNTGTLNALIEINGTTDALVSRLNQPVIAGVTYNFSFDAGLRGATGAPSQNARVFLYNADANTVEATLVSEPLTNLTAYPTYRTLTGSYTATTSGNYYLLFMNAGDGGAANDYIVDRVAFAANPYGNAAICDEDMDGIPNHLDYDSDGDGCSDSFEAGAISSEVSDHQFSSSPDVNGNGLNDNIESGTTGQINYTSTYNSYALSNSIRLCADSDNDGVNDVSDVDIDNDGIVNATESPDCFYTAAEMAVPQKVTTQIPTTGNISNVYDNVAGTTFAFTSTTAANALGKAIFEITPKYPQAATAIRINLNTGTSPIGAISSSATLRAEGWDGSSWVALATFTASPTVSSNVQTFAFASNTTKYFKYRLFESGTNGVAIGTNAIQEVKLNMPAGYVPSINPKPSCSQDTDGDSVYNHMDLDSDGDGCPDLTEAGVSPETDVTDAAANNNEGGSWGIENPAGAQLNTAGTDANNDGLNDSVDTGQDGQTDYFSTYSLYAVVSFLNYCEDIDNDGIPDIEDIDDDNDGILDAVESPGCFYTATEAVVITSVTSQFVSPDDNQSDGDIQLLHDGASTLTFNFNAYTAVQNPTGSNLFTIEYPTRVTLSSLVISDNISTTANSNAVIVGSNDGTTWSAALSPQTVITTTPITFNISTTLPYKFYRVRTGSVAGALAAANTVGEITSTIASGYTPSAHPKPNCISDTDNDGVLNHHDLDSDGDRCPDANEAGVISYIEGLSGAVYSRGDVINADVSFQHPEAIAGPGESDPEAYGANGFYNSIESNDVNSATYNNPGGYTYGDALDTSIASCICYEVPVTDGTALIPLHGTTTLNRAGTTMNPSQWLEPRTGAHLVLESKTKGFVITRLDSPETAITAPIPGMIVFDTDDNCIKIYVDDTDQWQCFSVQTCND